MSTRIKAAIEEFRQRSGDSAPRIIEEWLTLKFKELEKEMIREIENLIVEEILICRHENTPTSRLTSLWMRIKNLNQNEKGI